MYWNRIAAPLAALLAVSLLSACGGGGGGGGSQALSDDELDRLRSDPRVVRLGGIVAGADTLLIPSIRVDLTVTAQGRTESESQEEIFSCSAGRCTGNNGTILEMTDVLDSDTGVDLTQATLGSRGGFDTVASVGKLDLSTGIPDITFTDFPSSRGYGLWGQYGYAAVVIGDGRMAGRTQGVAFTGEASFAAAYTVGAASGTNPTGTGSATWTGIAEAATTDTFRRRQGTATLTIADLSAPTVSVAIDIGGNSIGSAAWSDIAMANGGFNAGAVGADHVAGNFYGPTHGEAYGVFDTSAYTGAFGAKRGP